MITSVYGLEQLKSIDINNHKYITKLILKANDTYIPETLVNLKHLDCDGTQVKIIPKNLINLQILICTNTQIKKIPNTLINLIELYCYNTKIKNIPNTLVNLQYLCCYRTQIKLIPNTLVNLQELYCNKLTLSNKLISLKYIYQLNNINNYWNYINKSDKHRLAFIKLQKIFRLRKLFKILWKIAEYYTAKKYSPENVMKFINLD